MLGEQSVVVTLVPMGACHPADLPHAKTLTARRPGSSSRQMSRNAYQTLIEQSAGNKRLPDLPARLDCGKADVKDALAQIDKLAGWSGAAEPENEGGRQLRRLT